MYWNLLLCTSEWVISLSSAIKALKHSGSQYPEKFPLLLQAFMEIAITLPIKAFTIIRCFHSLLCYSNTFLNKYFYASSESTE